MSWFIALNKEMNLLSITVSDEKPAKASDKNSQGCQ